MWQTFFVKKTLVLQYHILISIVHQVLGFDVEWKPNFIKGQEPNKVAIIQLATANGHCAVLQVIHFMRIPASLKELMADSRWVLLPVMSICLCFLYHATANLFIQSDHVRNDEGM